MNETSTEAVFTTTEFAAKTTTHPPYCIPHRDHRTISFCHKSVMAKLSDLSVKSQFDSSVRFPLYDVSFDDLVAICNDLTDARKCMDGVDQLCKHPLLVFLKEQFSATCQLKEMLDFDIDYNCIQNKLIERKDCVALLNTTVRITDKCDGHEDFLSCMKADLEQVCGLESYNSVVTMLRGYGCNISNDIAAKSSFAVENSMSSPGLIRSIPNHQKSSSGAATTTQLPLTTRSLFKFDQGKEERSSEQGEEEESSGEDFIDKLDALQSVDDVIVQNSGQLFPFINRNAETAKKLERLLKTSEKSEIDESLSLNSANLLESPSHRNERMDSFEISDPLFNYTISSNCTVTMRNKARLCTVPLMRTWVALRAVWPHLAQNSVRHQYIASLSTIYIFKITFPLYKYSRVDLLELCDSYADALLCSNMNHLEPCVMDELVRFAQDHLGYVCSPKNIQRFMKHYDCIMEQEALGRGNCRQYILGEAMPGKDEHKCHGVKEYRECLVPHLRKHCQPEAIDEFDATIRQFGCYTHKQHPNISGLVDL
uniref:DUF19 domain-containing protein n=1 Tax=Angiostrongylus cantonensis TaxID=6313 RepID=A0A158P8Y3_ANGCA